ncbi:BatD family protein [Mangrovicella endophytica]|uniref:BatD family protein n=1 Tax=Mangrovicella endophytica TaxID=2066697 RepID=UPI000C9E67A1|nr:BatD family protein [Mangrovicella endophytica]
MVKRFLVLLMLLAGSLLHAAHADAAAPVAERDAQLEVEVESTGASPFVDEMVLVTIRGRYNVIIALESLVQPEMQSFGWMQLGRDSWTRQMVAGREITIFERRLALFPKRAGRLTIEPFLHRLTLTTPKGERFIHEVASKPVAVEVLPHPKTAGDWWLPARSVDYSDVWDKDPATLPNGELATRTVTIHALGVPPHLLPPPPKMRAAWLITFMAPEERSVELTPDGPLSTVVWRWRMRPTTGEPGRLPAFTIPWYDTKAHEFREIVLKSQPIAHAGFPVAAKAAAPGFLQRHAILFAGAGGFMLTLAALLPGLRLRRRHEIEAIIARMLPDRDALSLRWAALRGDPHAARRAAYSLLRRRPELRTSAAEKALAGVDRSLFGHGEAPTRPPLRELAKALLRRPTQRER